MAKKRRKAPWVEPTPDEIVEKWHNRLVARLEPKFLEKAGFDEFEPKLRDKIQERMDDGFQFKAEDMKNSLKVAGDIARICKILQPQKERKKITKDLFEAVLSLASAHHQSCRSGGGGGGWCNLNN